MQLALIGDSILDNDIYVSEGKSIYDFLKLYLPQEFKLMVKELSEKVQFDNLFFLAGSETEAHQKRLISGQSH